MSKEAKISAGVDFIVMMTMKSTPDEKTFLWETANQYNIKKHKPLRRSEPVKNRQSKKPSMK